MTATQTDSAAILNAEAWYETLCDQLTRLKAACNASDDEAYEAIREEIQEAPLSLAVRSLWAEPGAPLESGHFCILLTTGGPGLRIIGDLGRFSCPECSRLEYQDWGAAWREYLPADSATLDAWAAQFYWGD